MAIVERSSGEMLRINKDSAYFAELFRDLKSHAATAVTVPAAAAAPVGGQLSNAQVVAA